MASNSLYLKKSSNFPISHKLYIDGCHQSSSIFSPTVGKAGPGGVAAGVTDTAQFNQSCTVRVLGRGRSLGVGTAE